MMLAAIVTEIEEKGILCFLGFHGEWVADQTAGFTVRRCGFCNEPDDHAAARRVRIARQFSQFPPAGLAPLEQRAWIAERTLQECAAPHSGSSPVDTVYRRNGMSSV